MKLWLDDQIDDPATPDRHPPEGWVGVMTAGEAKHYIRTGIVTEMSLDHDLGPSDRFGDGYQVACYVEELCHVRLDFTPPVIHVHSANPVGRTRILQVVESIQRICQQKVGGG